VCVAFLDYIVLRFALSDKSCPCELLHPFSKKRNI